MRGRGPGGSERNVAPELLRDGFGDALEELVAADGGVEVECVMGFVSFRGAIVGTMEHLGAAPIALRARLGP